MSSDTDERAAFEKWWKNQGWKEPTPFHYARLGWLARAAAEARADSAVPSSHVSETDQPDKPMDGGFHDAYAEGFDDGKAQGASILREALARLVAIWDRKEKAPYDGDEYVATWLEMDDAVEAARSALAGIPR